MIKITFPDGSVREYAKGTTAYQIAESISPRLAADSLAASVNGATVDMTRPIGEDASVKFYKWDDEEGKHAFWHTGAHIMAQAIQHLFPDAQFGIGPALDDGWYYDIGGTEPFTPDQFEAIEAEMKKIIKEALPLERFELPRVADALVAMALLIKPGNKAGRKKASISEIIAGDSAAVISRVRAAINAASGDKAQAVVDEIRQMQRDGLIIDGSLDKKVKSLYDFLKAAINNMPAYSNVIDRFLLKDQKG